jgi:phosphatidylinositol-3-phosphatase
LRIRDLVVAALPLTACLALTTTRASAQPTFDHVYVLMMENQSFDNLIGRNKLDPSGNFLAPDTPFITALGTQASGMSSLYFGVTHPSLPNYLTQIAGDYFGVQDDNASCFAQPPPGPGCHALNKKNLVDSLESAGMTWTVLEESLPKPGWLGVQWPKSGTPRLYAQKHNPFAYFTDIASNSARLSHILPLTDATLQQTLASPPTFTYIVPNQCHDMHGTTTCTDFDKLLREGDKTVEQLVTAIAGAPTFTASSVLFVVWDEDDYSSNFGCCSSKKNRGGGHTLALVVDKNAAWRSTSAPMNHYSLLKTVEEGLGLPLLGHSADPNIADMFSLL